MIADHAGAGLPLPPTPDLRTISRELATLRMRLAERRLDGRGDAAEIALLAADIDRLSDDLRRIAARTVS
jgi:hypothetical protein